MQYGAQCCGCGVVLEQETEFVAVMSAPKAEGGIEWIGKSVCDECHRDPAHRRGPLKAHFHPRRRGASAVASAGSSTGVSSK
jgi:hypothetical protein